MPFLLDEFLCLNKWVIRNNAIWNISERMKFMKLCLYKSGFFFVFRVCVCVVHLCVLSCMRACVRAHVHMETPGWCEESFSIALLACSLRQDLPIRPGVQLASSASSVSQLASAICLYLLRLGLQTPPDVYVGPRDLNSGPLAQQGL